jgi:thioredoxin reductase (NADPH)
MQIANPTFGAAAYEGEALVGAPFDWKTDAIALFSNSKPNAHELLEGIRGKLGQLREVENVQHVQKDSVAHPAPETVISNVVENFRAAVIGTAD